MELNEIIYSVTAILGFSLVILFVISFFASRSSRKKRNYPLHNEFCSPELQVQVITSKNPVQIREYRRIQERMRRIS